MRFAGKIGFGTSVEKAPGVWDDLIIERDYLGEVLQSTERLDSSASVMPNYKTTTSISVLSDGVLKERYSDVRYINHMGVNWVVSSIIHKFPRMEMFIGEEYHGPTPEPADGP
jgi:hypothetical protein